MPKKRTKSNSTKKKGRPTKIEDKLVHNMVELQKLHVDLVEKFDKLSDQIAGLLALFETTARTFANTPNLKVAERDKEFLEKINKLLEQNKVLAKGLTLMEEKLRTKMYGSHHENLGEDF